MGDRALTSGRNDARGKHLVILVAHSGRRNVSPHLDKLIPSLLDRDWSLHVIGWDREKNFSRQEQQRNIRYQMILRGGGFASKKVLLMLPVWWATLTWTLRRLNPRLVMAVDFECGLPCALATLGSNIRFIYNVRDNYALRYSIPAFLRRTLELVDRWIIRRATTVIFPDEIRVPHGINAAKVEIIRNCAPDIKVSDEFPRRPEAHLTVYAMGYLRKSRGIKILLEAIRDEPNFRVIAAGHCPEADLLEDLLGHPQVDFRGPLPMREALGLGDAADLIFTFYEPTTEINRLAVSNKWSDAMMMGRPILVNSEVEKSKWLTSQGVAVSCPYDILELRGTLKKLGRSRIQLIQMGKAGRRLYEQGYSWDVMEKRIHNLIEQVRKS